MVAASGVNIPIKAIDEFSSGINHAVNKLGAFQKAGTQVKMGMGIAAGVASFNLLASAAEAGVKAVMGMVQAANEDEASLARLQKTLDNNVVGWRSQAGAIDTAIDAGQRLGFTDDKLRESIGGLAARTKDAGEAIKLNALAMDLARAKGIDLATASNLIGKVYSGNVGILARYGVAVDKGATSTQALAAIQKMAGGQAQTYANTTEGSMATIGVAVGEVAEEFGKALIPVLQALLPIIRDKILPVLSVLAKVFGEVVTAAAPLISFVIDTAIAGFQMLANVVITAGQALMTIAKSIPGPWQEGAASVDASLQKIKDSINGLKDQGSDVAADVGPAVGGALAEGAEDVGEGAEEMMAPLPEAVQTAGTAAVAKTKTTLGDLLTAIRQGASDMVTAWKTGFSERNRAADIADQLIVKRAEITAAHKASLDKKLTAAERAEARIRERAARAEYAALLIEQTTYGTRAEQIAKTKALLTSKAMVDGLKSGNPDVVAQWMEVQRITRERLNTLVIDSAVAGTDSGKSLAGAIAKQQNRVAGAADDIRAEVREIFGGRRTRGQMADAGEAITGAVAGGTSSKTSLVLVDEKGRKVAGAFASGTRGKDERTKLFGAGAWAVGQYAAGMSAGMTLAQVAAAALAVVRRVLRILGMSRPEEGPLRYIDRSGEHVGILYGEGLKLGVNRSLAGLGAVPIGLRAATGAGPGGLAAGASVTVNVPIQSFYGTQDNITQLSRAIGQQVRLATVKGAT